MRLCLPFVTLLALACNSADTTPDPGECDSCPVGEHCVDGRCVPTRDASVGDGMPLDAGGKDEPDGDIDINGPLVDLSGLPQHGDVTNSRRANFVFTTEPGATLSCKRDGGDFFPCTSPLGFDVPAGPDGAHAFAVRATDASGNVGPIVGRVWTIDTTGPSVTIGGTPGEGVATNTPVAFVFSAELASRYECSRDAAPFAPCTSPLSYDYVRGGRDDGTHRFRVRAYDELDNQGPAATRTFVWDSVGPSITSVTGGPPAGGSTNLPFAFTVAATGANRLECGWDRLPDHVCAVPDPSPSLTEGQHSFSARAYDTLGNAGALHTQTFGYDSTPPTTVIDDAPADACPRTTGLQIIGNAQFAFSSNDATATFTCTLDDVPRACTSPHVVAAPAVGAHSFYVRARDAAGNLTPASPGRVWTSVAACP
jgi:large repetitive protein